MSDQSKKLSTIDWPSSGAGRCDSLDYCIRVLDKLFDNSGFEETMKLLFLKIK